MQSCVRCGKETTNPRFCSRSCAATYNNTRFPKRSVENSCKDCASPISTRHEYCKECYSKHTHSKMVDSLTYKTLGEEQSMRLYQKNSKIRSWARVIYAKSERPKCCEFCGYDKHYEIHHIKSISSFSPDTKISEINDLSNLIAVCPNHHWEIESGILKS